MDRKLIWRKYEGGECKLHSDAEQECPTPSDLAWTNPRPDLGWCAEGRVQVEQTINRYVVNVPDSPLHLYDFVKENADASL